MWISIQTMAVDRNQAARLSLRYFSVRKKYLIFLFFKYFEFSVNHIISEIIA